MKHILLDSAYYQKWKSYSTLKESSIRTYTRELKKFEKFIIQCGYTGTLNFDKFYYYEPSDEYAPINENFIDQYIVYLREELGASNHMLYDNIVYLRNFFGFLYDMRMIQHNPVAYYPNPYYERKIIDRSLSEEQCKRMLQAAVILDPFFRQYHVLLHLLLITGLRTREVISLTMYQIDLERKVIYVDEGQKTSANVVYISNSLCDDLRRYLSHPTFQAWVEKGNTQVFFQNQKPFTDDGINKLIKKISERAGIERPVTVYTFRHTMAYLMQKAGSDISIIQRQLRHQMVSTTIRYLPPV
ncbi:tyrosine-type recombinase/integrase [Aneurinibacillus migulanus]|uniref:Integrase/recombinase XerD n=1 Tax=Aneurinibacillus migulanus TaxID=47500 RepID=A0A0D1V0M7_ANEMI|nr:tyrosine-type recombinase/integrase [Aneurinibacillus migulanus]KIV52899.1 hypothetical protein TS65_22635 [Aneurinibacillus migulanus]KON95176.1 hypothetical protein AF333_06475 [Aneurinibacillus migulanus]MED0890911.1 tyrosine-type recombinase/integrase [Aneurinibacillus migulanus]MED1616603.1 tyrosine-type recombinase/integrase [Aneurinibacillus migulanus]SDI82376.1 integrase/recombinase XerD [Aneurinibacillus migulanus]